MIIRICKIVFLLAFLIIGLIVASYIYVNLPVEHDSVEMTIRAGTSVRNISDNLEKEKVIKNASAFRFYVVLKGVSSKLRAGDYIFESGLSMSDVAEKLLKGDFATYMFTIPEGLTVAETENRLNELPFVKKDGFLDAFGRLNSDRAFLSGLGIGWGINSLEGYLFPSTYEVYRVEDPAKLVQLMTGEFKRLFSDKILTASPKLKLSPAEIVTLASIVEKESSKPEERPVVASVFYNRLKIGMPLQSDPTVIYGLKNFDGNLKKSDLANSHRYNTYVHRGIPPGPICNPGAESINAVINPANTDYLYFVSKNDGTHQFSKTLEEHSKAVFKYQKAGGTR